MRYHKKILKGFGVFLITMASLWIFKSGNAANILQKKGSSPITDSTAIDDTKLLLYANNLDFYPDSIIASGMVQIRYNGYRMVAQKVIYNKITKKLSAIGDIEFIGTDGNRLYAEQLDITDNFARGFIKELRLETTNNTRLAAETAERINESEIILHHGVYTACVPCTAQGGHPPFWQVKAVRIIQNNQKHTIRLEKARLEILGKPIAYLPFIEVLDSTVKRKSGFLFPRFGYSQNLGSSIQIPYYQVLSDHTDATLALTPYSTQGLLLEAEFRQLFQNGTHILHAANINQSSPDSFTPNTTDSKFKHRSMISSAAGFQINPRWTFGWNGILQSDNNFSRTYRINNSYDYVYNNKIYLTGLGEQNYFDMRIIHFSIQDADISKKREKTQANLYPLIDYHYIAPESIANGELSFTGNITSISRSQTDIETISNNYTRLRGLSGTNSRLSTELLWKRTIIAPGGLLITPLTALRGDIHQLAVNNPYPLIGENSSSSFLDNGSIINGMATAGIETRYPIRISADNSNHIIEGIGQLYIRPNESKVRSIPNEDAQSLVFDSTSLFSRDKFSGYDRIEGGTRSNIGIRYVGNFDNQFTIHSIIGQSFQIYGKNSFAETNFLNVGKNSGLENKASDYIAAVSLNTPFNISLALNTLLEKKTLDPNRIDSSIGYENNHFKTDLIYTYVAMQPQYAYPFHNNELQGKLSLKLPKNWSILTSIALDIRNNVVSRHSIGLAYDDECTTFNIAYLRKNDISKTEASDWTIGAQLSFRTLGNIHTSSNFN
ncbi:Outer membrane protein Imp / Organic solvent tolerance protein precursor [Liberibacter crescens BT-1]|uniref:LPS-assembly protein LptD n=1 Tax=Liberibacter crescens (strain BT-1) TaxID=1215343 RepID=L0ERV8_LIBCB|nr:LPS-assembly protein LptD [Liberibacter crescens]AGA64234.1 Outer membrane protein Imp / Organic solvent tolerance protein precursor [Liberibacter crescens BT-1]